MSDPLKFALSDHEIEFLHKLHNAQAIKEMTEHPGWPLFVTISADIIARMENDHLNSAGKLSRDEYWLHGAELGGARKFAKILTETIAQQKSVLEQKFVPPDPRLDAADLDGDLTDA